MINYAVIKNSNDSILSIWYEDFKIQKEKHLRNGKWKKYHPNGTIKYEGNFTNGRLDGKQLHYDTSGVVVRKEVFVAGERRGDVQTYYKSGKLKMKGNYGDEVSLAIESYFTEKGVQSIIAGKGTIKKTKSGITEEVSYKHGAPHGEWKSWVENGELLEIGNYDRGEETGRYIQYNKSGQIKEDGYYVNGIEEGYWKSYYKTGIIKEEGSYVDGEKNGEWKYFYPNGSPKKTIIHKINSQDLIWEFWAKNGVHKVKKSNGEYFDRDDNGIPIKGPIKEGLKQGQWNFRFNVKGVDHSVLFVDGKKLNKYNSFLNINVFESNKNFIKFTF